MNNSKTRAYAELTAGVEQLPDGPQVGALFDFDGTIIAGYSATPLLRMQMKRGELTREQLLRTVGAMARFGLGNSSFSTLMMASVQYLEGIEESEYEALGETLFEKALAKLIYPEARALIEAHQRKGHTVAIISSALPYQVLPAARSLGIEHVHCSRLRVVDGVFTGEVEPPVCFGEGKLAAARKLARKHGVHLRQSCFYSDSDDDLILLEKVGHPRPVNPNRGLGRIARERDWPVQRFTSRGRPRASEWMRSLLATGAIFSSAASALPIWALTGSKRQGQNFSSSLFADVASALIGLRLNVRGEENLWQQRPAVFVFNHQSKADLIIIARLLRRNFTGVARKHAGGLPLFEKAMDLSGVLLIDLEQPRETVAALRELGERIVNEGISVAIAPEGTRSTSKQPGEFRKGAFQVAMAAGVPIVPIVIHNAMDVSPKGDFVYHPATVEVDVLPPVATSGWTRASMAQEIAAIRGSFEKTLGL